jgi:hypothetical protein
VNYYACRERCLGKAAHTAVRRGDADYTQPELA